MTAEFFQPSTQHRPARRQQERGKGSAVSSLTTFGIFMGLGFLYRGRGYRAIAPTTRSSCSASLMARDGCASLWSPLTTLAPFRVTGPTSASTEVSGSLSAPREGLGNGERA